MVASANNRQRYSRTTLPSYTYLRLLIHVVLESLYQLLDEPLRKLSDSIFRHTYFERYVASECADPAAVRLFKMDPERYWNNALECTRRYGEYLLWENLLY